MTPSEKYVSELCAKSFLPFWSFPNPIGKKNKELCDILVVCENTILIISVKDITVSNNNDELINYERWVKKAIHNSVDQIYGAERFLNSVDEILLKERKIKIKLPPKELRIIHRIAIAFGGNQDYPFHSKDFNYGFVHVLNEKSTYILLSELDTIIDFTNYLNSKINFIENKMILVPEEVDLLALYLQTKLDVSFEEDIIALDGQMWENYINSDHYTKWKDLTLGSYIWDLMIWQLYETHNNSKERRNEAEQAMRLINLETRENRAVLGEIMSDTIKNKVIARMIKPINKANHTYVFMPVNDEEWDAEIEGELILRCDVARYKIPNIQKVVGIAIGNDSKKRFRFNVVSIDIPKIDKDFENHVNTIINELGYFKNVKMLN